MIILLYFILLVFSPIAFFVALQEGETAVGIGFGIVSIILIMGVLLMFIM